MTQTEPRSDTVNGVGTRLVIAVGTKLDCDVYVARMGEEADFLALAAPGPARTVLDAVSGLSPEVLVIDPRALGDRDLDLVAELRALPHCPSIVALVAESDRALAPPLMRDGAAALVLKTAPVDELVSAIRWVSRGAGWISPQLLPFVISELYRTPTNPGGRLARLTAREHEVLQLMVNGMGTKQIAGHLFLSVETIRTHVRTIMEKLDVHSSTAAVSVALASGLRPIGGFE